MQITEPFIEYWARGELSSEKGRKLSGGFARLFCDKDGRFLWAEYPGSADRPYAVSADLRDDHSPRFVCSCPSRERPCKHALALLWARKLTPERFAQREDPPPQSPKARSKGKSRVNPPPRRSQGLLCAKTLLQALLRDGLDSQSPPSLLRYRKQLEALHALPGLRYALLDILAAWAEPTESRAALFDRISALAALLERAIQRAQEQKGDDGAPDWELDTLLGRVWRFEDLRAIGYIRSGLRLCQLALWSEDDMTARRYVDKALWADAATAQIFETLRYRPYEAARHIPPEDTINHLLETDTLVFYPGSDRVRWNACRPVPLTGDVLRGLRTAAYGGLREICGFATAKLHAAIPQPSALLRFRDIGTDGRRYYVRDENGLAFPLDSSEAEALTLRSAYDRSHKTILLRFSRRPGGTLQAKALALLSDTEITRLR